MRYIGIYLVRNTITNQIYIGASTNILRRWKTYIGGWEKNRLAKSIKQFGVENHEFRMLKLFDVNLMELPKKQRLQILEKAETDFILHFRKLGHSLLNINNGGRGKSAMSVVRTDMDGNYIDAWPSTMAATKALGLNNGCLNQCLRGLRKHVQGFRFFTPDGYNEMFGEKTDI
jgi:hypothetical protein